MTSIYWMADCDVPVYAHNRQEVDRAVEVEQRYSRKDLAGGVAEIPATQAK